jgi:hypothetical protein
MLEETRRVLGADTAVIGVMSGDFVQRGDLAIVRKQARARAAVESGVDLVLELPLPWAVSSAEGFAEGGVQVLCGTGVVTHLAFGSECGQAEPLCRLAEMLLSKDFDGQVKRELEAGVSFASARQSALEKLLSGQDASLLERHLTQVGLTELGDTLIPRCQELASMPFPIEFQFDVTPEGRAGDTFSASLRFSPPPGTEDEQAFFPNGAGGELMRKAQEWGLVDERWHELANTAFAKQARRGDAAHTIYCYPAFLKLRWREGIPVDAKAYLVAGIQ